jgi:hypothetical protein
VGKPCFINQDMGLEKYREIRRLSEKYFYPYFLEWFDEIKLPTLLVFLLLTKQSQSLRRMTMRF